MAETDDALTGTRRFAIGVILAAVISAAQTPTLLLGPADWRFERLPMPPPFAPDVPLKGFEEARFAPGMFDTASPNYFTYVLVITAEGSPKLDRSTIENFLGKYYKGLSIGVGKQKGLTPDQAQMKADVVRVAEGRYAAKVTCFDTFSDGRKLNLNIEAHAVSGSGKTYLTLLISPQPVNAPVWQALRDIETGLHFPEP